MSVNTRLIIVNQWISSSIHEFSQCFLNPLKENQSPIQQYQYQPICISDIKDELDPPQGRKFQYLMIKDGGGINYTAV